MDRAPAPRNRIMRGLTILVSVVMLAGGAMQCSEIELMGGGDVVRPAFFAARNASIVAGNAADGQRSLQSCRDIQATCDAAAPFCAEAATQYSGMDALALRAETLQQQVMAVENEATTMAALSERMDAASRARAGEMMAYQLDNLARTPGARLSDISAEVTKYRDSTRAKLAAFDALMPDLEALSETAPMSEAVNTLDDPNSVAISTLIDPLKAQIAQTRATFEAWEPFNVFAVGDVSDPDDVVESEGDEGKRLVKDLEPGEQTTLLRAVRWVTGSDNSPGLGAEVRKLQDAASDIRTQLNTRVRASTRFQEEAARTLTGLADQSRTIVAETQRFRWQAAKACGMPIPPEVARLDLDTPFAFETNTYLDEVLYENPYRSGQWQPVPSWDSTFWDFSSP
ncbi:MAG: hypothetical protein ACFB6R_11820 [Alphaproteobacteria bacterium]